MSKMQKSESKVEYHKRRLFELKDHPFVVPVITLLILVTVTLVGIIFFGATTLNPTDSHVVNIFVDDETRTLPTRAKTVKELLEKLDITINEGDVVEPAVDTPIYEDDFVINVYRTREVVIRDGKRVINIETASRSPRIIARNNGIVVYPEDEIVPEVPTDTISDGFISERYAIDRAVATTLILYGQLISVRTQSETVGELLDEKGIELSSGDNLQPARETRLTRSTKVVITRPGQTILTKEERIPAPTEYIDDPNALMGTEKVEDKGEPGTRIVTYDVQVKDGKEVSRKKIQAIVAVQPIPKIIVRGTKVVITDPSDNVKIGQRIVSDRGMSDAEFYCLYQLWQRESHWSTTAGNPTTGAYGIPQALPGSKMSSIASDWRFNPETQIVWGLGYISGRYGTPCGAWNFFLANNWY